MGQVLSKSSILLASSLVPIHPGAGRVPGLVDLPVQRDPLGYPYIPASEVKGSLKTFLGRKYKCINDGRVDCRSKQQGEEYRCKEICCLLGTEGGEVEGVRGASAVSLSDLYPFLVIAPNPDKGVIYVTTQLLLTRLAEILRASGFKNTWSDLEKLASIVSMKGDTALVPWPMEVVYIGSMRIPASYEKRILEIAEQIDKKMLGDLHIVYKTLPLRDRLVVLPESLGPIVINSLLPRITRIRVSRDTKTVERGMLWTEEYIPWGTMFAGIIADTEFRGESCKGQNISDAVEKLLELIGNKETAEWYMTIGGRETIGSGLLKFKALREHTHGG